MPHLPLAMDKAHRATAAGEMLTGECPRGKTLTIVAMLARPAALGTLSRQMPARAHPTLGQMHSAAWLPPNL